MARRITMRTTALAIPSLVLVLGACTPKTPDDEVGDESETGDGDPGDGDPGDGDPGDGDPGDGDGDASCDCPGGGTFDQCQASSELLLAASFTWPPDTSELELDEICTTHDIDPDGTVTFNCPAGQIVISVDTEPAWVPAFADGEQVRLRASESLGMSQGDDWAYLGWRIDRADDSAMLANYIGGGSLELIGEPYTIERVTGLCEPLCDVEYKEQDVAVRFIDGDQQVQLFGGQSGELGEHRILVGQATEWSCTDLGPGSYRVLITHTETPADACALVLDQSYSSQEQLECGLGPNGPELCNWTISFDGAQYIWNFSDVGDSGDYTCAGLDLLGVPEGDVLGSISSDGSVLTWDGVLYNRD